MRCVSKRKNKRAFTLVELMLAIAIIALISSLFLSLMIAIKDSYYRVYNANDSTDYAQLYAQALENMVLRDTQRNIAAGTTVTYMIEPSESTFMVNGTAAFTLEQMRNNSGDVKWNIYLDKDETYFDESSGLFHYRFVFVDGYNYEYGNPGTVQLVYEGTFWIPHFNGGSFDIQTNGSTTAHYNDGTAYPITNAKIVYTAA